MDLSHLNPQQQEAVHHGEGPLLILAGAGSGKTSTMAHRIAYLLLSRRAKPDEILGLSFTNKAAKELKERVYSLVEKEKKKQKPTHHGENRNLLKGLWITTFHSLCVRILKQDARFIGFENGFTIIDDVDQKEIIKEILKYIRLDDRKFDPQMFLSQISHCKNRFLRGDRALEYLERGGFSGLPLDYATVVASVYQRYQKALQAQQAMDFDDLIFYTVQLLEEHPEVCHRWNQRFRYLMVDEYQDTNPAQFRILRALTKQSQNLCVVGDDDQSIYSWRGADAAHILGFEKQFEGAKRVILNQNYRSTMTILNAANEIISKNRHRFNKQLWSKRGEGERIKNIVVGEESEESQFVAEEILSLATEMREGRRYQARPWKDFAILYRSNPQSRVFEESLRMRQIPYKIVGALSFLDRKEVKDLLSYWRVVLNPFDDASVRRTLLWPDRGVTRAALESLNEISKEKSFSVFRTLEALVSNEVPIPESRRALKKAIPGITGYLHAVSRAKAALSDASSGAPDGIFMANWAKNTLEWFEFKRGLEQDDPENPNQLVKKWENAEELAQSLGSLRAMMESDLESSDGSEIPQSGPEYLREFISRLYLDAKEEERDKGEKKEKDEVTLMTLHGAKGLEFPVVFLVGMEEGFLPHQRTLDEGTDISEERRLAYVGVTRAKDRLYLTRTMNRIRWGKTVPRLPSRFLEDIGEHLLQKHEFSVSKGQFHTEEARERHEGQVKDFLSQIRSRLGESK